MKESSEYILGLRDNEPEIDIDTEEIHKKIQKQLKSMNLA